MKRGTKDVRVHFHPVAEKYINFNGPTVAEVLRERQRTEVAKMQRTCRGSRVSAKVTVKRTRGTAGAAQPR